MLDLQNLIEAVPELKTRDLINGRWWNTYTDGTRLPYIAGGSDDGGDDGDGDKGGDDDGDKGADGGDDDQDPDGADKLGDPGKRALDTMKGKWRTERDARRAMVKEFTDLGYTHEQAVAKLKELAAGGGKDKNKDQPDADEIREQAKREAQQEALKDRTLDRVEARAGRTFEIEVEGKASKVRFADPEDAAVFLRDKTADFIDGDKIDTEAIDEALKELLERKPNLAAKDETGKAKKFDGDADSGARKTEQKKAKGLAAAVDARYAKS